MHKELIPMTSHGVVTHIDKNTETNINIHDSNVTLNMPTPVRNQNALLLAVESFSTEYYQIIVTKADIFSEEECGSIHVSTSRALRQGSVPPEIFETCSSLSDEGKERLKTFPAIICREKENLYYEKVSPSHMAVYASVKKIINNRDEIRIYYDTIQLVPLKVLCENPIDYGVNVRVALSDFNISHWIVKKIDLFGALEDTGLGHLPRPSRRG